jgi:Icc-related predicted phosphoesterase
MRILAIGDFHGKFPQKLKKLANQVDLILCTGDFGGSDKLLKIMFKHLGEDWTKVVGEERANKYILEDYNFGKKMIEELEKLPVEVNTIHGNWDFEGHHIKERWGSLKIINYSKLIKKMKNIKFLRRGDKKNIFGLNIFAYGGPLVPFINTTEKGLKMKKYKRKRKIKKELKQRKSIMKHGSKDIDIFLAHYCPYGYFDKVNYKGYNPMNGKNVGIKGYTDFIKKFQPKVFICGHMHEYQGLKKLGKTMIVTTGPAKEGKAAVIDFPLSKKGKIKIEFVK